MERAIDQTETPQASDGPGFADRVVAMTSLDDELWLVVDHGGQHQLQRVDRAGVPLAAVMELGALGADVRIAATRTGMRSALIEGDRAVLVREQGSELVVSALGERQRDRRVWLGGRGVAERRGGTIAFRGGSLALPADLALSTIIGGALVLDGSAVLVVLDKAGCRTALLFDVRGPVRMRIRLGDAYVLAIAERRGIVVLGRGAHVALLELRAGRCIGERILPAAASVCSIDADARRLIVIDASGETHELTASLTDFASPESRDPDDEADNTPLDEPSEPAAGPSEPAAEPSEPSAAEPSEPAEPRTSAEPVTQGREPLASSRPHGATASNENETIAGSFEDISNLSLAALGPAVARRLTRELLADYLADARGWVVASCRAAIGRTSPDAFARAQEQRLAAARRFARWSYTCAPHIEVARELGLSPLALSLLLLAAAPQIWGELARPYGVCTDDPARPLVDELLLAHLLDADHATRAEIGRQLDPDAPLVASGAVAVSHGVRPYAAITVHPAIARRLAGAPPAGDAADRTPATTCALTDIIGPRAAIAAVARRLAGGMSAPARVVLRGRAGVGRRTAAAAFAARSGRRIGLVTIDGLAKDLEARLRDRLQHVALRGDLPCVTLDDLGDDPAVRGRVRAVLDKHPGPLFVRAPRSGDVPLSPGFLAIDFTPLTETERSDAWRSILASHALDEAPAAALAARFSVGPGAMVRACAAAVECGATGVAVEATLIESLRQHRSARIEAVATRVEVLASWADLIVPEDIADALSELCARVLHRRTVLERWGLRTVAPTARGVTALFQGGPGTGKTMAAEVIANALGYELWRVDLSKVVSKWIGETEKNLAAVFDAAEDGEIVLLFDEADSLFGKRTEVKSSHDRNANLETNYLLQRLDMFTGVAILTTNFGTAIDPAFQRRLSVQAQFQLPDEQDRERLWRALLPPSLPVAEDLDLAALARKFALTGGYIRNAVLRAAYRAAGRGTPLSTADLERAVRAEYHARGRVSTNGALP